MSAITWLDDNLDFPPVDKALADPEGLLAIGGDLSPQRLVSAYRNGIFPWFSEEDIDILWWSPDPRAIYPLDQIKLHRSMKKIIRNCNWQLTVNRDFANVIQQCSQLTPKRPSTWITQDMLQAYIDLHQLGYAHSVEVWQQDQLIGGLYGVAVGSCFCGESMFSTQANASKVAFYFLATHLKKHGYQVLDCQLPNPHLNHLGAVTISRADYIKLLLPARENLPQPAWNNQQVFSADQILDDLS